MHDGFPAYGSGNIARWPLRLLFEWHCVCTGNALGGCHGVVKASFRGRRLINGWLNALQPLIASKKSIPKGLAYAIGWLMEGIYKSLGIPSEPRMTRFLANELSRSHWFDISAAKRDLGYVPEVSLTEGLEQLKDWMRK